MRTWKRLGFTAVSVTTALALAGVAYAAPGKKTRTIRGPGKRPNSRLAQRARNLRLMARHGTRQKRTRGHSSFTA